MRDRKDIDPPNKTTNTNTKKDKHKYKDNDKKV